ncbi:hypothetical protein HAX54_053330, partial [Datura stramonium]|nr:hypothetical protein [Datura stramonium]
MQMKIREPPVSSRTEIECWGHKHWQYRWDTDETQMKIWEPPVWGSGLKPKTPNCVSPGISSGLTSGSLMNA